MCKVGHWNQIVNAFTNGPEKGTLNIAKSESGKYSFIVQNSFSDNDVRLFGEIIGKDRFARICKRMDIDTNSPAFLTKENVHKVFIGMMDIRKEDIEERGGSIETIYPQMMFFNSFEGFENAFLVGSPNIEALSVDKASTSGKGFKGLTERVSILANHYFTLLTETNEQAKIYRDAEMLSSRLADREIQKGTVVPLRDGYFYADEVFVGGGAYVAVLRDFNGIKTPKIILRGTAMRKTATDWLLSGLNDLLVQIGIMGTKSVWPKLSKYLKDNGINKVEVLGKSLGGAHAQELAVLIEGVSKVYVEQLTTCCSVGVDQEVHDLFEREVLANRTTPFNIRVLRNEKDRVPGVAGSHLGSKNLDKCNTEFVYLSTAENVETYPLKLGFLQHLRELLLSFGAPHCRQNTLGKFFWKKIEDKDEIERHLQVGNQLEIVRKTIAWAINLVTFFIVNGRGYKSYFGKARESEALL